MNEVIPLIYDQQNESRIDIDFFIYLLKKSGGSSLADLGCGTGTVTELLVKEGYKVTAIDPNEEALAVAKSKYGTDSINWIVGDSRDLESSSYDHVLMSGNVSQVFLTDESWKSTLINVYGSLKPGAQLLFDTRNSDRKIWESWEQDTAPETAVLPDTQEKVEIWTQYEGLRDSIYTFYETVKTVETNRIVDKVKIDLKFRTYEELVNSLYKTGFTTIEVYGDWSEQPANMEHHSFIFRCIK